jgi:polyhydroxybutyrate depolymerase
MALTRVRLSLGKVSPISVTNLSPRYSTSAQTEIPPIHKRAIFSGSGILVTTTLGLFLAVTAVSFGEAKPEAFTVDGVERQALVYSNSKPGSTASAPVVFVFYGHGGTAQYAARRFRIHELWPEAVVVYMQGIPGVRGITDPDGKLNGWQKAPGDVGDGDLKFFDAVLERIQKRYKTDPNRVYVLGHSNGGRFVNVLWNSRGDKLAALCSAAGPGGILIDKSPPKSVFIIAGEKDPLVPFQTQQNSILRARRLLKTDESKAKVNGLERTEPGVNGSVLVTYVHPGGHEVPLEALPSVAKFFPASCATVGFFVRRERVASWKLVSRKDAKRTCCLLEARLILYPPVSTSLISTLRT